MNNLMCYAIQKWNRRFAKWVWYKWYADEALRDRAFDILWDVSRARFRKVG